MSDLPSTDAPRPTSEKLQIGDLVIYEFNKKKRQGILERISDGSERGFPGELMYEVNDEEGHQALVLHRSEILGIVQPEKAIQSAAEFWKTVTEGFPLEKRTEFLITLSKTVMKRQRGG